MELLIRKMIRGVLAESSQQAMKAFLTSGKISQEEFNAVMHMTKGDGFTTFMCGIQAYDTLMLISPRTSPDMLYSELRSYSKDLLPIKGMEKIGQPLSDHETFSIAKTLIMRSQVIEQLSLLPSIAKRNMKEELRLVRDTHDMENYLHIMRLLVYGWGQLQNRPKEQLDKIAKKVFSSKYPWISEKLDAIEDAASMKLPMKGMDEVYETIENCGDGAEIVQDDERVIVVRITEQEAIKALGCNSSWCFSMPASSGDWENYSTNDTIYWVANKLRLSEQYVIVAPYRVYDIHNQLADTEDILKLGVRLNNLHFGQPA